MIGSILCKFLWAVYARISPSAAAFLHIIARGTVGWRFAKRKKAPAGHEGQRGQCFAIVRMCLQAAKVFFQSPWYSEFHGLERNRRRGESLMPRFRPWADQRLDLGKAPGNSVNLGLEPDDSLEMGSRQLRLAFQFAHARPQVRCAPRRENGLTNYRDDERERHFLIEVPLSIFQQGHGRSSRNRYSERRQPRGAADHHAEEFGCR